MLGLQWSRGTDLLSLDVVSQCECCTLVFQTDADEERLPVMRKTLFPLFHSQRSFTRSSSERERPLVATAMVQQSLSHTVQYATLTEAALHDSQH